MNPLHSLSTEQIEREISKLRKQAEASPPHLGLLAAQRFSALLTKVWRLEEELQRRKFVATRGKKREAKKLRYAWTRDFVRNDKRAATRMERESRKRLAYLLELPDDPKPQGGLPEKLGVA